MKGGREGGRGREIEGERFRKKVREKEKRERVEDGE